MISTRTLFAAALLALAATAVHAQDRGGRRGPPGPEGPVAGSETSARDRSLVQWFGTLEGARAEAQRTGKPILLLSAAPQCHGISGVW